MSSLFVFIVISVFSLSTAIYLYSLNGLFSWSGIISVLLLSIITWPALDITFFSSEEERDKMTGVHEHGKPNLIRLLAELLFLSRYVVYAITAYLPFIGFSFYTVLLTAIALSLTHTFEPININMIFHANRVGGVVGVLKHYCCLYIPSLIIVSFFYGLGLLIQKVL
ncbi:hypothetical protein BMR07_17875 [Methylococcaceae bacterium CS1]|nr:hypothetical protein BMR10_16990 [Methylococcaceae bacterium CS4]TXK93110.1 hypothetical protein BMR11_17470 [Methylococcaceae bacterium CS5]TXL02397.1 hypothetical protein BMR07_17875 [Methylococcaceae bacterium CS1]TXL03330.1 hypothetical protein BMR08_17255 [Methylococcaceae bacterium CS2]